MPCVAIQLTVTLLDAGCGKLNAYGPRSEPLTLVAAAPLMRRSGASTPPTSSLKATVTWVSDLTTPPGAGLMLARVGATRSMRLYCHEAAGAAALNALGIVARSVMPWFPAQVTRTVFEFGCGKRKVYVVPPPVAFVEATPLMRRSEAFTLVTGLEKTTVISVRLDTEAPAGGICETITGGTKSRSVYCQLVPGAVASKAFGG